MISKKGKNKGRQFEYKIRKFFIENGCFVYVKGVSTPGPDILAIKGNKVFLIECKNYSSKTMKLDTLLKNTRLQIKEYESIKNEIIQKTILKPILMAIIKYDKKYFLLKDDEIHLLKNFKEIKNFI